MDEGGPAWTVTQDMPMGEPLYERYCDAVLGLDGECGSDADADARRCFNCGSPEHVLSACPDPLNRPLVSLSRQLYAFFRSESAGCPFRRVHEVEEWRRQRLEWLETFEPGHVRGPLLREALGLRDGDVGESVEWLRNIACWGYPRGWVGGVDPRERVWKMVADADEESDEDEEDTLLTIFGEDEEETFSLRCKTNTLVVRSEVDDADDSSSDSRSSSSSDSLSDSNSSVHRWATYPATYFHPLLLPVYNGFSLPPLETDSSTVISSSATDGRTQWQDTVSGSARPVSNFSGKSGGIPPWRLHDTFVYSNNIHYSFLDQLAPPPPPSPPPPLPPLSPPLALPPPDSADSPPPHSVACSLFRTVHATGTDRDDDIDMDLSD